jgi:hypothetical protein
LAGTVVAVEKDGVMAKAVAVVKATTVILEQ